MLPAHFLFGQGDVRLASFMAYDISCGILMSCHTALITFTLALPRNFFFFFATILTLQGLLQIIEEHDLSDLLPDCFARIHNSELWHAVKALAKVTSQKSRSDPFVYAISINSIFGRGAGLLWKYFVSRAFVPHATIMCLLVCQNLCSCDLQLCNSLIILTL